MEGRGRRRRGGRRGRKGKRDESVNRRTAKNVEEL